MTAAVAGSSGVWHVGAGQEMLSWYRTGCGPAGCMLINQFKLNCLIRVTTLRAHWMIKHRLCWYMHTHSRQPFDRFLHNWNEGVLPLFSESYSTECKGNLKWVRLELPAPTYQTSLGCPTPHNTIKTIRRAHQDTKKNKEKQIWEWPGRNLAVCVMPGVINNLTVIGTLQKAVSLLYLLYPLARRVDLLLFGSCWTMGCVCCSVFISVRLIKGGPHLPHC